MPVRYCFVTPAHTARRGQSLKPQKPWGVTSRTIEHIKKRFVEDGFEAALERKQRETPPRAVVFDGEFEARLIALACSEAPEGHSRWTMRLLADKAVELKFADSVSHMTAQRILKK